MAFEKKNKTAEELADDEKKAALAAAEEFGEDEEVEEAAIPKASMQLQSVAMPVEDPHRLVKVTPRLQNLPAGSSLNFRIGDVDYGITDGVTCRVPLDVARQLREKGLIPGATNLEAAKKKKLISKQG